MPDISDLWGFEESIEGKTAEEIESAVAFRRYHLSQQDLDDKQLKAALKRLESKRKSALKRMRMKSEQNTFVNDNPNNTRGF